MYVCTVKSSQAELTENEPQCIGESIDNGLETNLVFFGI
jgi:hypothetical protein